VPHLRRGDAEHLRKHADLHRRAVIRHCDGSRLVIEVLAADLRQEDILWLLALAPG
jgi:hypothetical protein